MMNSLDKQYQALLQDILDNGVVKGDRTGTGTKSVFGRTIRHKMSEGFPILTTKKVHFKSVVTELLWFLRGDTNIKYLVDNNVHIWDGDAYKNYCTSKEKWIDNKDGTRTLQRSSTAGHYGFVTKEEFIDKIKTDDVFAEQWGDLGPIYGKQWRKWVTSGFNKQAIYDKDTGNYIIDQISNLISDLKTNPDSRRLMVTAWNPAELYAAVLPPCHYGFQCWTRELSEEERQRWVISNVDWVRNSEDPKHEANKYLYRGEPKIYGDTVPKRAVSLSFNQRSVDTLLGLPFNIASYGLLLHILAKLVNMVPEDLIGNLGDTHLYSNHFEQAKEQIGRDSFDLPKLNIVECPITGFDLNYLSIGQFKLENYQHHEAIKAPLSN